MPNGPTAFLRFDVEEFASLLKALPPEVEAGVAVTVDDLTRRPLTAGEMLQLVLSGRRQQIPVEEQYGSYYIVHLLSEGMERQVIGVYERSPLFPAIRQRHHRSNQP